VDTARDPALVKRRRSRRIGSASVATIALIAVSIVAPYRDHPGVLERGTVAPRSSARGRGGPVGALTAQDGRSSGVSPRPGAACLPLQTAEHYVAVEALGRSTRM
jgi:hypothetical protein